MRYLLLILLCLVPLSHAESFLDRLPLLGGAKKNVILPPDKAFGLEVSVSDETTLFADFRITPGYYLYRDKVKFTILDDSAKAAGVKIANVSMPKGEMKFDPNFGDTTVFYQSLQAVITLDRTNNTAQDITLAASYQGCKENDLCYAPIDKQFNIVLPKASLASTMSPQAQTSPQTAQGIATSVDSENTQLAKLFKQGSFWLIVSFFFGAGLLLTFTPCVLPMIPILSGIIVGHSSHPTKMHSFLLSLTYVLGMALTYAAIGVAAGLSGTLLSSALQTPWVLGSFAALFVLLSLSMFGFYELQLPAALQSKLTKTSNRLHGGHLSGVFLMGALSAIIVSPCVAAPMAAALLYIGQTHDALLGGTALFALAIGMGLPLLLIGSSAGALLPKAGAWMEAVKHFFGVLMLALAIWLISTLIPLSIQMLLWAILLILSAIYMRALDALPNHASGWQKLWKGVGILALLLGSAFLIGALSGARDILQPLAAIGNGKTEATSTLKFERIKNVAELDTRIAQANGKTVMLDFYADWCISCKEMERFTFTDAKVQAKLRNAVLLQIDVTANNDEDKALLKRFELFGPPAILFFDAQGREQGDRRVIGYQNAGQFLQSLNYVGL
ncbi:protein-disulfide reductase DsbD [Candidatus Nitrotoga sp. M5]|uniref:protein-disulfide reductase DsbD n=1 Tax=Candidatus Nitrotoga sp. M5 TaxID=2890409 RepID=UPI001EF1B9DD|nr:protein-disulfide reductase DsbD [Candidatus Nitrotoga sp. M5]CAH1386479.1 Thiol:disulfide interchange protein DsbD [Candidatus Nitrotoga sp. M5]